MTLEELANLVMDKLGVNEPGEPIEGQDMSKFNQGYAYTYGWLQVRRLATWSRDDIPDSISTDLAVMIAANLAMDYGLSPDRRAELEFMARGTGNALSSLQNLRKYSRPLPVRTEAEFTHY